MLDSYRLKHKQSCEVLTFTPWYIRCKYNCLHLPWCCKAWTAVVVVKDTNPTNTNKQLHCKLPMMISGGGICLSKEMHFCYLTNLGYRSHMGTHTSINIYVYIVYKYWTCYLSSFYFTTSKPLCKKHVKNNLEHRIWALRLPPLYDLYFIALNGIRIR